MMERHGDNEPIVWKRWTFGALLFAELNQTHHFETSPLFVDVFHVTLNELGCSQILPGSASVT